jgi:hypothetical protein
LDLELDRIIVPIESADFRKMIVPVFCKLNEFLQTVVACSSALFFGAAMLQ